MSQHETDVGTTSRRVRSRAAAVIEAESLAGAVLGLRVRRFALAAIAALAAILVPWPDVIFYLGLILVFVLNGEWLRHRLRGGRATYWHAYSFIVFDMILLVFTITVPNPLADPPYPSSITFLFGNFIYVFVLLALLGFAFRPAVVLVGGIVAAVAWATAIGSIASLPGNRLIWAAENRDLNAVMAQLADPTVIDLGVRLQEIGVLLIVAGVLAAIVARSRQLVLRQAMVERERANLARYFPPAMVDRLATRDAPLAAPREAAVAVLFADVVGFTAWAQARPAAEVIGMLCDVHARLEAIIFEHGGTLDKFMGDGVMATFGTPEPAPDDAVRAIACARSIVAAFPGDGPLRLGVGAHYGPVVMGDVGSERRMEFAVLGDTVNVASRLEGMTRRLDVRAVLSDDLVLAAAGAGNDLVPRDGIVLRGRVGRLRVWTLGAGQAASSS